MELTSEIIKTCAITDLIAGVLLIPMTIILIFKKTEKSVEKKYWITFIFFLMLSCFLGFITHYYFSGKAFRLMWIPLYTVMYETVNAFFLLAMYLSSNGKKPDKKAKKYIYVLSTVLWAVTLFIEEILKISAIRVYAAFAVVLGLWGFISVAKHGIKYGVQSEILLTASIIPLLPAAYFQIERKTVIKIIWEFNYNGITHIFLIVAMILIFASSLKSLQEKKEKTVDSDVT